MDLPSIVEIRCQVYPELDWASGMRCLLSVASFLCTIQKLQRIIDCHMFCVSRLDTGQISLDAPASLEELFVID